MYKTYLSYKRMMEISNGGGELYIRCAGKAGKILADELKKLQIEVTAFLDVDYRSVEAYKGIPVLAPETVYEKKKGSFFVMIAVEKNGIYDAICEEYRKHGLVVCEDFADFSFHSDGRMMSFMDLADDKSAEEIFRDKAKERLGEMIRVNPDFDKVIPDNMEVIPNLDVPLTTFCSLSCKYCSHCIPYAKPPRHFDLELLIQDILNITTASYIVCLAIMGGEPFVYADLTEFVKKYKATGVDVKVGFTRIITNGTVVPADDFFYEYKKLENAYIYISNYGSRSRKLTELANKCRQHRIPVYVCPETDDWLTLGDFSHKRNYTEQEVTHLFSVCDARPCVQLLNGRIYSCPRIPLLNEDGLIPFSAKDYCSVRGVSSQELKNTLHNYLYNTKYLDGCQYCDGQHRYSRRIPRGEQS